MKILGFEITRAKQVPQQSLMPPSSSGWGWGGGGWGTLQNWFGVIQESFTGAWQRNVEIRLGNVLTFHAVFACIDLISNDIAKMRLRLMEEDRDDITSEVDVPAFSPVLRKPNRYQTRVNFIKQWMSSKLTHGNTYVLKGRDERRVVTALYVLDPLLTKVLIAPDGDVFYQLSTDLLAGISEKEVIVPASEIIHDINTILYHALCGVSPITACGLAAVQGLNIQNSSAKFFGNNSNPGGILTAPGLISDEAAKRLKEHWELNYTGNNVGKVAVLGDGLEFKSMTVNAADSKLLDQLKWTAETVCTCFHVPPYMIGVGPPPNYNNIEALNQQYYSQCLQVHIESIELLLNEGLGLTKVPDKEYGTEFDLADLLRMDSATKIRSWGELVSRGIASPNEARAEFSMKPVDGGESPLIQQQNFSLPALAKRDAKDDPFATTPKTPAPKPAPEVAPPEPQKLLAGPPVDWSKQTVLKGIANAGA